MDRRSFLNATTLLSGATILPSIALAQTAPAVITRDAMRPKMAHGIQSGDPTSDIRRRGDLDAQRSSIAPVG